MPRYEDPRFQIVFERNPSRSFASFSRYYNHVFGDIRFRGRAVLDIGGGSGTCTFIAALLGATSVVCLEPENHGSTSGFQDGFVDLARSIHTDNTELRTDTFQEFEAPEQSYDVLILHNSINHLDEPACIDLLRSHDARQKFESYFEKLFRLARLGADLVIADCSSKNLFPMIGIPHPLAKSIEWEKHQPPEVWAEMLQNAGFSDPIIRWTAYASLGRLGEIALGNRLGAFLTTGHFVLRMKR